MKLRTEFHLPPSELKITHQDCLFLAGSCFAENIGQKLVQAKFKSLINPLGISFNPISLFKLLALTEVDFSAIEKQIQETGGINYHFDFHSSFNQLEKGEFIKQLFQAYELQAKQLKQTKYIFLALGTAWIYEKREFGIVNNCHKVSSNEFSKRLLTKEEIVEAFSQLEAKLKAQYQNDFTFLFTVSPVRHIKDGFHENQLSKSVLQLAVNQIQAEHNNCHYFPAYELVIDDLRDYRFFEADLVHPNQMAVDYIWDKFQNHYFSSASIKAVKEIETLVSSANHRAFQPNSESHQKFLEQLLNKMESAEKSYSISFEDEKEKIKNSLLPK